MRTGDRESTPSQRQQERTKEENKTTTTTLSQNKRRGRTFQVQQANPVIARHNRLFFKATSYQAGDWGPNSNHYIRLFFAVTVSHLFHHSDYDARLFIRNLFILCCGRDLNVKQGAMPVQQRSCDMTHVACHYHVPNFCKSSCIREVIDIARGIVFKIQENLRQPYTIANVALEKVFRTFFSYN